MSGKQADSPITLEARSVDASYAPTTSQHADNSSFQLKNVSLKLSAGELVAVIGPNGSGKSTLVRALSRTLPPASGSVLLNGRDLYSDVSAREAARAIAVVPQSTDVFLDFTVRDIVAMGRAPHRSSRGWLAPDTLEDAAAVDRALQRMGIGPELAARSIADVSGGERQRALIARSLAQESSILLLDEPIAALDLRSQRRLLHWLRELAATERRCVVAVLHDLSVAAEFAERLIVLSKGRIVSDGPVRDALTPVMIKSVYGIRAWVRSNPATDRPVILPLSAATSRGDNDFGIDAPMEPEDAATPLAGVSIHLFCGAGTGVGLMANLAQLGAAVSVGVLWRGDMDEDAARTLGLRYALAEPFARPSGEVLNQARVVADAAQIAALTAVPRGEINGAIFDAALAWAQSGRPMVALEGRDERGELDAKLLCYSNVRFVSSNDELLAALMVEIAAGRPTRPAGEGD